MKAIIQSYQLFLKTKFGIQLKDGGIEFHNIYKIINFETRKETILYLLMKRK